MIDLESLPDARGHFGPYGGMFVPETLMTALNELTAEYEKARKDASFQKELDYLLREYGVGDFYRAFQVSEVIDPSRIQAEYSGGVLTLHLPKSEAAKPRKIAVQAK